MMRTGVTGPRNRKCNEVVYDSFYNLDPRADYLPTQYQGEDGFELR